MSQNIFLNDSSSFWSISVENDNKPTLAKQAFCQFLRYLNTSCTITPNTLTLVALNTTNTLLIPRFLKTRVAEVLSYQALVHWVLLSASTLIAAHPTQHFWNICTDRQHICTGLPSLPPFEENDCTKQNVQQRERWSYAPQQELVCPGQCALCTGLVELRNLPP